MESKKPSFLVIFTLYLIYFLDLAGMAIVFILFAPLIIDGTAFLPADVSKGSRNIILGFLFAAYPLAQFFGAPILGEYSDRIGRKKPLFISAFFTALTFCLSAFALEIHSLYLLFFSRILSGFSAGNMTIAQAAVGDLIEESKRPRYMALFNIVGGISWIIAPYAGTLLSDERLVSWFSSATPFWVLGAFFLLSALIVFIRFEDLVGSRGGGSDKKQKETLAALANYLGYSLSKDEIAKISDNLYGGTWSFREGKIGKWKKYYNKENKQLFKSLMGQAVIDLGYEKNDKW